MLELVAYYLLFICFSRWGVGTVCLSLLFQRHAIVLAACVTGSCAVLLLHFGCGVVPVMALVYFVFIYNLRCIFVMCMRVFVCPECLRCAACIASLSPLVFHGSRRELWATVVPFFSVGLFLFVVPLTSVILLDAFRSFVGKFWFLIRYIFKGFSQCRVVVGYALQVFPVVTRLTVYRRLQVTRRAATV